MAWYHPGSVYQALSQAWAPKPVPQPVTQPRPSLLPSFLPAVSANPHAAVPNHVITNADAHPPTLRVFNGMGMARASPFAPPASAGVWGGSLNSTNVQSPNRAAEPAVSAH